MTNQQHPITPPPELVLQWLEGGPEDGEFGISKHVATQAARWGADQELEACCEYLTRCAAWEPWEPEDIQEMRDLRRPEPPSLKERLDTLHLIRDHTPQICMKRVFSSAALLNPCPISPIN
jgi:hypothetical protein